MNRRYIVGGVDVTDSVRANVARFGRLEDADDSTQLRLRDLFGPAITAARRGRGSAAPPPTEAAEAA